VEDLDAALGCAVKVSGRIWKPIEVRPFAGTCDAGRCWLTKLPSDESLAKLGPMGCWLIRVFGDVGIAEDAVKDARVLLCVGGPWTAFRATQALESPTTGRKRAIDRLRRESRERELPGRLAAQASLDNDLETAEEVGLVQDAGLRLVFTCCHPAPSSEVQMALTWRLPG
jgi:predicted RNA polymerase sigma factor